MAPSTRIERVTLPLGGDALSTGLIKSLILLHFKRLIKYRFSIFGGSFDVKCAQSVLRKFHKTTPRILKQYYIAFKINVS